MEQRETYKLLKHNNLLLLLMKKLYTQPTLESIEMAIEQGIAASLQTVDGIGDIYLTEEEVNW